MINQTLAILLDAYRELNARKMFWISLAISMLVVASFACLGIDEKGLRVLWWTVEGFPVGGAMIPINTDVLSASSFYKLLFSSVGIGIWLGWASTILALVSTASVIPDFASSGIIEGMLARPISRVRLFLTKYCASLLFVVLQALVFTVASILVIGVRGGEWLWSLLLAVPLVTLFFSYIYCVSALVGVWTRSTLAALLAGLAVWGACLVVNFGEAFLLFWRFNSEQRLPLAEKDLEATRLQLNQEREKNPEGEQAAFLQRTIKLKEQELVERRASRDNAATWHRMVYAAKTVLPKTGETKELLERAIVQDAEMEQFRDSADRAEQRATPAERRVQKQVEATLKGRTWWWIIGTSLAFEGAVLALACWVFARRDF